MLHEKLAEEVVVVLTLKTLQNTTVKHKRAVANRRNLTSLKLAFENNQTKSQCIADDKYIYIYKVKTAISHILSGDILTLFKKSKTNVV